jgi:hypothetical protein
MDIWPDVFPGDWDIVRSVVVHRPLLFGPVDLAKVVDAGVKIRRVPKIGSREEEVGGRCRFRTGDEVEGDGAEVVHAFCHVANKARERKEDVEADFALHPRVFLAVPVPSQSKDL